LRRNLFLVGLAGAAATAAEFPGLVFRAGDCGPGQQNATRAFAGKALDNVAAHPKSFCNGHTPTDIGLTKGAIDTTSGNQLAVFIADALARYGNQVELGLRLYAQLALGLQDRSVRKPMLTWLAPLWPADARGGQFPTADFICSCRSSVEADRRRLVGDEIRSNR
jgi:hypothetical protein